MERAGNLRPLKVQFVLPPGVTSAGRFGILENMKLLPVKGGVFTMVDDDVFEELSKYKWFLSGACEKKYVRRRRKVSEEGTGQQIALHRLIIGAREGDVVDHKDLNPLNNQRENLRICTTAQNLYNKKATKVNKLGVKGVFLCSVKRMTQQGYKRPYRAKCKVNGVVYLDRTYYTIEEAKAAYDACARQHQGEFSRS